jgi:hypothetical protein
MEDIARAEETITVERRIVEGHDLEDFSTSDAPITLHSLPIRSAAMPNMEPRPTAWGNLVSRPNTRERMAGVSCTRRTELTVA